MVWICHHILHFRINCTVGLYNDTAWATRSNVIYSDTMVLPEHQRRFFLVFCRQVSLGVWVENEIPNPFTWMPRTCAPEATSLADWYLMLTVPCNLVSSSTPYRNSLSGIWNKINTFLFLKFSRTLTEGGLKVAVGWHYFHNSQSNYRLMAFPLNPLSPLLGLFVV